MQSKSTQPTNNQEKMAHSQEKMVRNQPWDDPELSDNNFKATIVIEIKENILITMNESIANFSRKIENTKKNKREIIELKCNILNLKIAIWI